MNQDSPWVIMMKTDLTSFSILQWYFNCTIAGCTIKQNNDTKLSMSIHDAVNGENVIADEQVFYWNMSDSESVSGTYQ